MSCWPFQEGPFVLTDNGLIAIKGKERRCPQCKIYFKAHIRLKERQKTCGSPLCQKKNHATYKRQYRKANPESEMEIQKKRRENRPADYWKVYRANHPNSTNRNRITTKLRRRLKKQGLQRQLDIVQVIDQLRHCAENCKFATSRQYLIEELSGSQHPEIKTIEEG